MLKLLLEARARLPRPRFQTQEQSAAHLPSPLATQSTADDYAAKLHVAAIVHRLIGRD